MGTLTIRLPEDSAQKGCAPAAHRGVSLNKLFDEFSARAIAEFDVEMRFRVRAARGNPDRGLAVLDKLDKAFGRTDA